MTIGSANRRLGPGTAMMRARAAALAVLVLVAVVYWPVRYGGFVWDDQLCFHDAGWLRDASWIHYLFRGFCDWTDYFRPLAVAVYTLQVRAFDSDPGSMHLVSLGMHLLNTLLVRILAVRLRGPGAPAWPASLAMLVYGLHPALIEPVFWVGCQYEMLVVLFAMLGLIANATIGRAAPRALAVASCFFLAACSKESAVAFPLVLFLFDLAAVRAHGARCLRDDLLAMWRQQSFVYFLTFTAGLAYLALRHWAIGETTTPLGAEPLLLLPRMQKAALAYVSYWKLIVWPMTGLGPIHPAAAERFARLTVQSVVIDAAALAILAGGVVACIRRRAIGNLILTASAALTPVLHLVPIAFNESIYHERYTMLALAMACAWLPSVSAPFLTLRVRRLPAVAALVGTAWLALAVVNIRVTLPLWSDELALWQWAARDHPDSVDAMQHLLAKYLERGDRVRARALADALMAKDAPCPVCMLSIAYLALNDGDAQLATTALDRIRNGKSIPGDPLFLQEFIMAQGRLQELRHEPVEAAIAYRDSIAIDPLNPDPKMNLALLLLREGDIAQARAAADAALELYAPDERRRRRTAFEELVKALPPKQLPVEGPIAKPMRR